MKKLNFTLTIFLSANIYLFAQDTTQTERNQQSVSNTSGNSKFLLTGYGFTGFEMEGDEKSSFGETGFAPIFLWKSSDKLFFEGELEVELEDGETEITLAYANVNYILNKYITIRSGKFLSPFGTFQERLHPAWINKSASKPLGFGHDAVGPGSETGLELRSGIQLGVSKMNYSLYVSNGPTLNTGGAHGAGNEKDEEEKSGILEYNNFKDNNRNKAIGGRLGFLPFSNSSLELGFSFQQAKVGSDKEYEYVIKIDSVTQIKYEQNYKNIGAQMWAVDLSYTKSVDFLKGIIDIKGQLSNVTVDKATYYIDKDSAMYEYEFDNVSQSYYAQLSYRPALLTNKILQNIELVGRYSGLMLPEKAKWGEEATQLTFGLNYWTSWRSVLKFNYQITGGGHGGESETAYLIQFAIGF